MKWTIMIILITAIMFFATGCGPGQPFEIEPTRLDTPQPAVTAQLAAANTW